MNNSSEKYLRLFGVTEAQMRQLVAEGLRSGGDWCDLYFEDTAYHDLLLRDGVVGSGGYHVDYGCGIRVLKGEKTGFAYAESTDLPSLLSAARAAGAIASSATAASLHVSQPPETSPLTMPPARAESPLGVQGGKEQASLLARFPEAAAASVSPQAVSPAALT